MTFQNPSHTVTFYHTTLSSSVTLLGTLRIYNITCAGVYIHILGLFSYQPCPTLCDSMDCSTPGLLVPHQLPEFAQIQVYRIGDAIQPSQRYIRFLLNAPASHSLLHKNTGGRMRTEVNKHSRPS